MRQHILTPTPPLPTAVAASIAPAARELLGRLLEKEASQRYANAGELLPILQQCIDGMTAPAPSVVAPPRERVSHSARSVGGRVSRGLSDALAFVRRRPKLALIGAVVSSVVVVTATASSGGDASRSTPSAPSTPSAVAEAEAQPAPAPPRGKGSAAPATSGTASGSSSSAPAASSAHERHAGRHTGPGGIYIPPPNRWFR